MPAGFQPLCAAIVALYVALVLARSPERARLARRLLLLAVAAWAGEDSLMRLHGAYAYAPTWSGFLDRTPVLIPCIWPVVVHSAWELARRLAPGAGAARLAALAGALVVTDAAFIEPIAVRAGLWSWSYPGPFEVPLVGVLTWGFFAAASVACLEASRLAVARSTRSDLVVVMVAPVATHVLALAAWWGALRWLPVPSVDATLAGVWALSAAATIAAWRRRPDGRLAFVLAMRVPGALMFGYLLAAGSVERPLVLHAVAFVPPYLALLGRDLLSRRAPGGRAVGT